MATAISILYTIKDGKNLSSTMEVKVPSATSFTNAIAFGKAFAPLINAVITGAITRIGVALSVTLPAGLNATPGADSDVEEGADFQFRTAGGFFTGFRIPTFDEDLISSGSQDVNTEDTDVAALIAGMISGVNVTAAGGTGTIAPSDLRDDDVTALSYAREAFQKSR